MATMNSGAMLSVKTGQTKIRTETNGFETIPIGTYSKLSISDTGTGIDVDALNHIFESFYSDKDLGSRSGSGLGLSVVHGVVKDFGGWIDVKTALRKGTCFDIYFPSVRDSLTPKTEIITSCFGMETILIADDVEEQREVDKAGIRFAIL